MSLSGVLVVDKPRGPTSHDVVARARRALGTRAIGHAGTLDPMATGVLVLAVGEATKLVSHLTAQDKEYEAVVALGVETHSLDADGEIVEERRVPAELSPEAVRSAAARFVGAIEQRPPAVSAIKVGGRALHRRVRAGEAVEAPMRRVEVRRIDVLQVGPREISLRVESGKGFYVRSLARDLARALDTVGHLTALRRIRSGDFTVEGAASWESLQAAAKGEGTEQAALRSSLRSLREAWGDGPVIELLPAGAEDARHGRAVPAAHVVGGALPPLEEERTAALLDDGRIVALAQRRADQMKILRGIRE